MGVGAGRPHVALVGLSGVGKSTAGRALARLLEVGFADTDSEVEHRAGSSVAELFADVGEDAFRRLEHEALADLLSGDEPLVVATGGGIVLLAENRAALAERARTVWLRADAGVVLSRLAASGTVRPLLTADPAAALDRQAAQRAPLYQEVADVAVDVDLAGSGHTAEAIVAALDAVRDIVPTAGAVLDTPVHAAPTTVHTAAAADVSADAVPAVGAAVNPAGRPTVRINDVGITVVRVSLGERSYPVHVGAGVRHLLAGALPAGTRKVAIVTQAGIGVEVDPGCEHRTFLIGDGEAAKTLSTVERLCSEFSSWGLSRADCVVAVGGGLVTDVAGFAASVYHRGVPVVHVPTTLLGQVDAAIGGKTGVNLPEGKNLVGAYWQPAAVFCDTDTLATLPERELRSGMGEVAKYHWLGGGDLDSLPLDERVAACVRIKAEVVAADEREGGRRATLNYGHTLAHAIETAGTYDLRHGEAVAIGLVYAAEVAARLGRVSAAQVAEHRRVVDAYGLPGTLPAGLDNDELLALFGRDKKALRGLVLVLDGPRGVEVVEGIDEALLRDALEAVR